MTEEQRGRWDEISTERVRQSKDRTKPKRGRPHSKPEDKRSKQMTLRLTENEMYLIEQIADIFYTTKTSVVLDAINKQVAELRHSGYSLKNITKK